jgi:type IV pilus assembly protein PilV
MIHYDKCGAPRFQRARNRGFTMVEALVALVVLAIGLLGIAALYLDSLRAGRTAIYRTQAVNLAADIADRIRANRGAVLAYTSAFADTPAAVATCEPTELDVGGAAVGCGNAELASTDLSRWKAAIAQRLPEGQGQVEVVAPAVPGDPAFYSVTVRWTEVGLDDPIEFDLRFDI